MALDIDWGALLTSAGLDGLLIFVFGFAFLDKARDEFRIVRASDRLTKATARTELGWALRNKGLTLGWLILALGIVFLIRGVPGWEEPRWLALMMRLGALAALILNKYWRRRTMRALDQRTAEALDGTPTHAIGQIPVLGKDGLP
jgi:hypothetical protein